MDQFDTSTLPDLENGYYNDYIFEDSRHKHMLKDYALLDFSVKTEDAEDMVRGSYFKCNEEVKAKERYERIKWSLTLPKGIVYAVIEHNDWRSLELLVSRPDIDINEVYDRETPLDFVLQRLLSKFHNKRTSDACYKIIAILHINGAYYTKDFSHDLEKITYSEEHSLHKMMQKLIRHPSE